MKKLFLVLLPILYLFTSCNFDIQKNQFCQLNLSDGQTLHIALENGSITNANNLVDSDLNSYSTLVLERGFCSFLLSVPSNNNLAIKYSATSDVNCNIFSQNRSTSGSVVYSSNLIDSSSASSVDNTFTGITTYNNYYVHLACSQKTTIYIYNLNYE